VEPSFFDTMPSEPSYEMLRCGLRYQRSASAAARAAKLVNWLSAGLINVTTADIGMGRIALFTLLSWKGRDELIAGSSSCDGLLAFATG
jgi:hypothetical protein